MARARSIKPREYAAAGATPPRTGPGPAVRLFAPNLTHDDVGDSTALPGFWINWMPRSRAFWLTVPMMERLHGIC